MTTKSFEQRWLITGVLETTSPLHIGDGGFTHRNELKVREKNPGGITTDHSVDIPRVATDTAEKPYLPGRCLKDNLRAWVRSAVADSHSELINRVFGAEDEKGCAGRAEFWDARLTNEIQTGGTPYPYWCAKRQTGVRSRTAIARRTKTVQEDKLFYVEYVPPDVSFSVDIAAQGLTAEEVAFLLFALDGFENGANPEFRVRLGAAQDDFWGEFRWKTRPQVTAILTQYEALAWAAKPDSAGYVGFPALPKDVADRVSEYKKTFTAVSPEMVVVKLELDFDSPLLVNEPSATGKVADGKFNASAFRTPEGKLAVPSDSFRGAFRSQAEKILRTQGERACCVSDPDNACLPIESTAGKEHLCPACLTFGAPGWGTPLRISDFVETATSHSEEFRQEFVAVDRFSGGSADQFKFNADSKFGPTLEGKLVIETGRMDSESRKLLAFTLRDLIEGDIPLGSRSGKGYGALTCRILSIEGINADEATNHLRTLLSKFLAPAAVTLPDTLRIVVPPAPAPAQQLANNGNFHNPYHFVPVAKIQPTGTLSVENFAANANPHTTPAPSHLTHDRYVTGTADSPVYSGRIICRLENETEMVIGARQEGNTNPKTVIPFEIGCKPAIPGSSLRGLISSTAEAASNSALRVLSNTAFSRRVSVDERTKLDAIGILRKTGPDTWDILPLTLPTLQWNAQREEGRLDNAQVFEQAGLRVYLDGYRKIEVAGEKHLEVVPGTFLANGPLSYCADNTEYWYMKLGPQPIARIVGRNTLVLSPANPKIKNNQYLVGQIPLDPTPIPKSVWDTLPANEKGQYKKGMLRVLGIKDREKELPMRKIHELFLPLPPATAAWHDATQAVREFHKLANQRTESVKKGQLPFELKGSKRNDERAADPNASNNNIELRSGDLVCFRANNNEIVEVAVSSIWRKGIGDCYDFFKAVDPELLPFNDSRKSISIAEQMFGFVEQNLDDPSRAVPNAKALASRLRFAFGTVHDCPTPAQNGAQSYYSVATPQVMKILSSPKPPSPSLYFRNNQGNDAVTKQTLDKNNCQPMGRKFYLHHPSGAQWQTNTPGEHVEQKVKVKPIHPHTGFYFHVDFDNLTERELGLLCYSLQPTPDYRHKLGMGKPLGLGTVRIDPIAMLFVSRSDRYAAPGDSALSTGRYDFGWFSSLNDVDRLPSRYSRERDWIQSHQTEGLTLIHLQGPVAKSFADLRGIFATRGNAAHRGILERIGNSHSVVARVHYPLTLNQQGEGEGFKWFVVNDNLPINCRQKLQPVNPAQISLPVLRKN
jgi:CRISPR/Cas system CSM-associated protein Csm3 (group 7 of RAMP superfamily)